MPDPTCLRYFLQPDGSLDPVTSPGRCATYWRLRDQALFTDPETGGHAEMQIKLRLHEQRCPYCRQYFADCEKFSHNQPDHHHIDQATGVNL
jgi:hypothetical protein